MNNETKLLHKWKIIALFSATIALLSGLLYVISWHFGWINILLFPPSIELVSYASSIGICLAGLGILALFIPTKLPFTNIFGVGILLLAISRIIDMNFNLKIDFTEWVAPWIPLKEIKTSLMPGLSSVGFILMGAVLSSWTKTKRHPLQSSLTLLASYIVFLLGISGALSYLVPTPMSFLLRGTPLNFYSQISVVFIGLGLIAATYYYDIKLKVNPPNRLSILVTIILSIFAIFTSWSVALEKIHLVEKIIQSRLNEIRTRTYAMIQEDITLLQQLTKIIELENKPSLEAKTTELISYLQTQKELQAIIKTNSEEIINFVFPQEKNQNKLYTPLPIPIENQKKLQEARANHQIFIAIITSASSNGKDFLILNPTYQNQIFHGFVGFIIDSKELFENAFLDILNNEFSISVFSEGINIFNLNTSSSEKDKNWEIHDNLKIENLVLTINMNPTKQILDTIINRTIIYMIFFGGFIIALSAGVLSHFWQLAHSKINEVEDVKKQLMESKKEQLETLKSAQIGTWNWDLKTNKVIWDDFSHILFGMKPKEFKGSYFDVLQKIVPEDRDRIHQYLRQCIDVGCPIDCSYQVLWPNDSIHTIISKGKLFLDEKGNPEKMTGISWEITSIKQAQLLLEVSEAISKVLSENAPMTDTFDRIIQTLYHYLGWSVITLWLLDAKTGQLNLSLISHIPTIKIPEFEKASFHYHPEENQSLSHIYTTYRPTWFKDVTKEPLFTRTKEAEKEGLKGSIALPILEGTHVIGVIELFKQKPFDEVSEGLLNLIASIGVGIGQYIQRKSAEESRTELAAIVTNAQDGIYSLSLDGTIKYWNVAAENILGWKADEVIGKPISITYPNELINEFEEKRKKILDGHSIDHFEAQVLRKDGTLIWVDKTTVLIKDQRNKPHAIATILQDISKEKEILDALTISEEKFRDFVEATEEWFWEIDNNFVFTYSNPIIKKFLGYLPEEVIGKDILSFTPKEAKKEIEMQLKHSMQIKEGWSKRINPWIEKEGSTRWLESNAHPILDDKNNVIGFRGADRDVTERKLIEKSKKEFISMVNHELRTPLTSVMGALGLVRKDTTLSDKIKDLCNIAYRNSERLASIINDILDIEKLELGKFEFDLKPTSLLDVIDEGIRSSEALAEKSNIKITKEGIFKDTLVLVDRQRLIQVFMNLFSNAFKFSPKHSAVHVAMETFDQQVRISIRDQGIGIADEFKSKVFQKFAQADSSDSRKTSGTGLGLNICKNLIEGMKGSISFKSKKGEGTIFYLDLPLWKEKK